jgi:hypothetical protein
MPHLFPPNLLHCLQDHKVESLTAWVWGLVLDGERFLETGEAHNLEVAGSNPAPATI